MRIITRVDSKTLYQRALEVVKKYENQTGNLTIKQFKTSVEFVLIDKLFNTVEFFKVDFNDDATYYSSAITQQTLNNIKAMFGEEQFEKFVFSIVQHKFDILLSEQNN